MAKLIAGAMFLGGAIWALCSSSTVLGDNGGEVALRTILGAASIGQALVTAAIALGLAVAVVLAALDIRKDVRAFRKWLAQRRIKSSPPG